MQHERYEQALARYQDSLRQLPGYPASRKGFAKALLALGRTAEAIPYLEGLANEGDVEAQDLLAQIQATP
jgi:predicted Zn-dependent protease